MSVHLGPARQNGYVVPDLDAAIAGWLGMGVGPWVVYPHVPLDDFAYRGVPGAPDVSIALANSGALQIELIEQHDSSPSLYRDYLDANPTGGLQHLGYWVDHYDEVHRRCLDLGWTIGHEGTINGGRFAYFDTEFHGGTIMEIAAVNGRRRAAFARIEQMADEWNGIDQPTRVVDLRT